MTAPDGGPVFVVGPMRSGTTLLRLMLNAHPALYMPDETAFMLGVEPLLELPGWRYGSEWYTRLGWSRDEHLANVRSFVDGLFRREAARVGASRWGDKTPLHVWHVEAMAAVFPDARFVGIVRHPCAVVQSMVERWQRAPDDAIEHWRRATGELVRVGRVLDDRFVLVRYEDLVRRPEPVLRAVVDHAGLPWSDDVLHHDDVYRRAGEPARADGGTERRRRVDTDALDRWAGRLGDDVVARIDEVAGDVARFLGYDPRRADVAELDRLGVHGAVVRASELDELARRPGAPRFEPQAELDLELGLDPRTLAQRLALAERALANLQRRRAVRAVDAVRRWQRAGVRELGRRGLARLGVGSAQQPSEQG